MTTMIPQSISELTSLEILDKKQACALLGCNKRFLEKQMKSGRLRYAKPSYKLVRIFRADLDAFLNASASQ